MLYIAISELFVELATGSTCLWQTQNIFEIPSSLIGFESFLIPLLLFSHTTRQKKHLKASISSSSSLAPWLLNSRTVAFDLRVCLISIYFLGTGYILSSISPAAPQKNHMFEQCVSSFLSHKSPWKLATWRVTPPRGNWTCGRPYRSLSQRKSLDFCWYKPSLKGNITIKYRWFRKKNCLVSGRF